MAMLRWMNDAMPSGVRSDGGHLKVSAEFATIFGMLEFPKSGLHRSSVASVLCCTMWTQRVE